MITLLFTACILWHFHQFWNSCSLIGRHLIVKPVMNISSGALKPIWKSFLLSYVLNWVVCLYGLDCSDVVYGRNFWYAVKGLHVWYKPYLYWKNVCARCNIVCIVWLYCFQIQTEWYIVRCLGSVAQLKKRVYCN